MLTILVISGSIVRNVVCFVGSVRISSWCFARCRISGQILIINLMSVKYRTKKCRISGPSVLGKYNVLYIIFGIR